VIFLFLPSTGYSRSYDLGHWFQILAWFNFNYFFQFHHLTLYYWALSFLIFLILFSMGLSWVEVSQVNPSLLKLLLFLFFFYPLTLGYWVLRFLIFYVFPFYGVILGRELVKLTRCDLGFFFSNFIFYLTSILFFTRLFKKINFDPNLMLCVAS